MSIFPTQPPKKSQNFWHEVWEDASPLTGTIFCLGDRPGSWIVSNTYGQNGGLYDSFQGLTYLRNLFMDPGDSETWGTVGLYMGLFCPSGTSVDQYTELKVGFAFNKCNSGVNFMLSISADTIECFADKFAPVISRLAGLIPELSFGISIDRKLSKTVTVAHGDGDSIRVGSITLHSHLAMSTTIRLSIGQLLGMDDTIGDVLAGDLQAQFAVAYDSTDSLVSALTWMASSDPSDSLPDLVGGFASAYKVGPTAAAALLRQSGAANQAGMERKRGEAAANGEGPNTVSRKNTWDTRDSQNVLAFCRFSPESCGGRCVNVSCLRSNWDSARLRWCPWWKASNIAPACCRLTDT